MVKIYYEQDADLNVLKGKTVAVIGYGNQGRNQALNLKDSGVSVIIGARSEKTKQQAKADGLPPMTPRKRRPRLTSFKSSSRTTSREASIRTTCCRL